MGWMIINDKCPEVNKCVVNQQKLDCCESIFLAIWYKGTKLLGWPTSSMGTFINDITSWYNPNVQNPCPHVMNELTFDEKCPKFLISGGGFLRIWAM